MIAASADWVPGSSREGYPESIPSAWNIESCHEAGSPSAEPAGCLLRSDTLQPPMHYIAPSAPTNISLEAPAAVCSRARQDTRRQIQLYAWTGCRAVQYDLAPSMADAQHIFLMTPVQLRPKPLLSP